MAYAIKFQPVVSIFCEAGPGRPDRPGAQGVRTVEIETGGIETDAPKFRFTAKLRDCRSRLRIGRVTPLRLLDLRAQLRFHGCNERAAGDGLGNESIGAKRHGPLGCRRLVPRYG